jgi:hypothetical protein
MSDFKETREIVLNRHYGGFGLSEEAVNRLLELGYKISEVTQSKIDAYGLEQREYWVGESISRLDPLLIQVVRELGPAASADNASLEVSEVTVFYDLISNDGIESVEISVWTNNG